MGIRIIAGMVLFSLLLYAAPVQEVNVEGEKLLKEKRNAEAYTHLLANYKSGNYNTQTLFLLGLAAKQLEKFEEASGYFQDILIINDAAHRVRLEWAIVLYKMGEFDRAKEELLTVKASNPPRKVGANVDKFLAILAKGKPKNWQVGIGMGYFYDTNVNAGPEADTVILFDIPFQLTPGTQKQQDSAWTANTELIHSYSLGKELNWQTILRANFVEYNHIKAYDSESYSGSTGPIYQAGNTLLSVPLSASQLNLGNADEEYYRTIGVTPSVMHQLSKKLSISGNFGLTYRNFNNDYDRDSKNYTFSPSAKYYVMDNAYLDLGGYLGTEEAKNSLWTNNMYGINGGASYAFTKSLSIYAGGVYSHKRYKEYDMALDSRRLDIFRRGWGDVTYNFTTANLFIKAGYAYTNNGSNQTIYDYTRHEFSLMVTKQF